MIRNTTPNGAFADASLFKVRNTTTGLYFLPSYRSRNPWSEDGKSYASLQSTRSSVAGMLRATRASYTIPDPSELEIVEFTVTESGTHSLTRD